MRYLKTFENFVDIALKYASDVYQGEPWGHLDYDDIEDRLESFGKDDFPYGLNNIPNPLFLYRLLNVDDKKDINLKVLGKHWVGDKDMLEDQDFLYSSSILGGNDPIKKWFIITVETSPDNLDIEQMLGNRAEYPEEYEFTLKDDKDLKVINIEEIDPEDYR